MIKVLAVVALLGVAQIIPSCGDEGGAGSSRPQVIGWVDEKMTRLSETNPYLLVINQIHYGVPYEFWRTVDVGDLVKLQGDTWTIVRKGTGRRV
ncbi:MAG: hypothetical protein ACRDGN_15950 [bacterium]